MIFNFYDISFCHNLVMHTVGDDSKNPAPKIYICKKYCALNNHKNLHAILDGCPIYKHCKFFLAGSVIELIKLLTKKSMHPLGTYKCLIMF